MKLNINLPMHEGLECKCRQVQGSIAANAGATTVLILDCNVNEQIQVDARIKASAGKLGSFAGTVNTGTDQIVTATAHGLVTGSPVIVTATVLPTGAVAGTVYFVNVINATTIQLHDTQANAVTGGATGRVDLTTAGTDVLINGTVLQAHYRIQGVVRNRAGTTALLGTVVKDGFEDVAGWDANLIQDNTNDKGLIQITPDTVLATRYDVVAEIVTESIDA